MLYLYQSNRLENLARVFTGLQKLMPPENPLAAEEIVVQSQGMRHFLNLHLAKELGVAANLKFSLPAGLTWRLMRECLPGLPELSPFAPEVMRWRLLESNSIAKPTSTWKKSRKKKLQLLRLK